MALMQKNMFDQNIVYQIKIQGDLDHDWLACFEGLSLRYDGHASTISGNFADQASLRRLLNW